MRFRLALCAALVAALAAPSPAKDRNPHCARWRHGQCISPSRSDRPQEPRPYAVGHLFGPGYSYVDVGSLPGALVRRYHLQPGFRYVREGDRLYVVDPRTFRVLRAIRLGR